VGVAVAAPFHLAFPVHDIESTRTFYRDVLGCDIGRESDHWIDIDFFGNQISAHVTDVVQPEMTSEVDGIDVPLRHLGAILDRSSWRALGERISSHGVEFLIPPTLRYEGQPGEQGTMFIRDPSGNGIEFKTFTNHGEVFAI
jgi:uncharacterized protein